MFISDGSHMRLAFIHPHSLIFIKPAKLQNGTIFRLVSYNFTSIAKQKTIILSTIEIVANNHDIIGEPKLYLTAADDDFTTTVFGSAPLGPRPSSPTADFQEYLDASCGNDQHSPFQLHPIPTTENLPSSSSKSTKHKISKPHDQFHAQIHLPSYPNSALQSQFSKPYQPQQSQSCKELLNEMYGLPYYVPPPLSASPYFLPQHDDCWRVEADVLKGRLLQLDLEMKREKDDHQAEVARLKADMEDYQNQVFVYFYSCIS
ncbi:uncharacterized protein LOC131232987 [Magnolia sinica]|uniref:uncharacterized protein LOC131232987 n=1 Tax=Magnolia sinica TaxID=86752 RepID=UPI00265A8FCC|nr:uncharacterized protein LOC131232987 [Magnolia sinica]